MINVAIVGVRGYKVIYSGFETFVRKLIEKSNKKKITFVLFTRRGYEKNNFKEKNLRIISIPVLKGKYLETPIYALISSVYSLFLPLDVVLYLSVANAPFLWIQKLRKRKIIINVDGLDWKRRRWSGLGKIYLKVCEYISIKFASVIIADSMSVYKYYRKKYRFNKIVYIPYGAEVIKRTTAGILKKYNLKKDQYFLFVGRFVPENCIDEVIMAFRNLNTDFKCVIVGESFFEQEYKNRLVDLAKNDKRIIFTGILKDKDYEEICSNSFVYVETKSVGGIHPSLLEAMAFGNCIVAKKLPEHIEVLADTGLYYDTGDSSLIDLNKKMNFLLHNPNLVKKLKRKAEIRVMKYFRWEKVIDKYHKLFV